MFIVTNQTIKIYQEKSKINVFNKMTKTALDEEISAYVAYHRYQRLIAVKIVSNEILYLK